MGHSVGADEEDCIAAVQNEVDVQRDVELERAMKLWRSYTKEEKRAKIESGSQWWAKLRLKSEWDDRDTEDAAGNSKSPKKGKGAHNGNNDESDELDDKLDSDASGSDSSDDESVGVTDLPPYEDEQRFRDWLSSGAIQGFNINDLDEAVELNSEEEMY